MLGIQAMADVLTEEEVKRWHDLEEQRIFERSGRAAYCPRCSAKCLEADDGSNCAQCPRSVPAGSHAICVSQLKVNGISPPYLPHLPPPFLPTFPFPSALRPEEQER